METKLRKIEYFYSFLRRISGLLLQHYLTIKNFSIMTKKIYCFINGGKGTEYNHVLALCEDGHCLAGHLSSSEGWARHDIGINSDWKHEKYKEHCPEGYELIWVDDAENSPEVEAAYKLNQEIGEAAKHKENQPQIIIETTD